MFKIRYKEKLYKYIAPVCNSNCIFIKLNYHISNDGHNVLMVAGIILISGVTQ